MVQTPRLEAQPVTLSFESSAVSEQWDIMRGPRLTDYGPSPCFAHVLTDVDSKRSFKLIRLIAPQPVSTQRVLI